MKRIKYGRPLVFAMIMIALGVVFMTTDLISNDSIGRVFIAVGGLFLIIGMAAKLRNDKLKEKENDKN